ncbi:hypothetical protein AB0H73_35000 [Streptomyces olivoreticuli]
MTLDYEPYLMSTLADHFGSDIGAWPDSAAFSVPYFVIIFRCLEHTGEEGAVQEFLRWARAAVDRQDADPVLAADKADILVSAGVPLWWFSHCGTARTSAREALRSLRRVAASDGGCLATYIDRALEAYEHIEVRTYEESIGCRASSTRPAATAATAS